MPRETGFSRNTDLLERALDLLRRSKRMERGEITTILGLDSKRAPKTFADWEMRGHVRMVEANSVPNKRVYSIGPAHERDKPVHNDQEALERVLNVLAVRDIKRPIVAEIVGSDARAGELIEIWIAQGWIACGSRGYTVGPAWARMKRDGHF